MNQEQQKRIEKLKTSSALTFDEILDLLTGKTLDQIEKLRSQAKLPKDPNSDPDIKPVKFLKDVLGDPESGAYNIPFQKGEIYPVRTTWANELIGKKSAEELCASDVRKWTCRIEDEKRAYQEIKDQHQLLENLEEAVLDRDIESLNDVDSLSSRKWRLPRKSILCWIKSNWKMVCLLRHFPAGIKDPLEKVIKNVQLEVTPKSQPKKAANGSDGKKKDKGGNPGVDPDGKIASKIEELKSAGVRDEEIPWDIKFTKLVQKLRRGKINPKYLGDVNCKIHRRVKGPEYTGRVGISLDTAKKLIEESS